MSELVESFLSCELSHSSSFHRVAASERFQQLLRFLFSYHSRPKLSRRGITPVNPTSCGVSKKLFY